MKKGRLSALAPIAVFLLLYLGTGVTFEYILKIPMGFYNIPIVVMFMAALLVACLQNRKVPFAEKLEIMARGLSDKNIITMILIFIEAGMFVGIVGRDSAESVAYFMLSVIPPRFAVCVLFVVSCFVSLSLGSSVGTITLIAPISVAVSSATGFGLPILLASVIGGAMFGDNLSFISDTTIAACQGQGCKMSDKFKSNFFIALPAAIVSILIIMMLTSSSVNSSAVVGEYNFIEIIPYILVLICGIIGINVFVVLLIGIMSGAVIMLISSAATLPTLLSNMGSGASGMFETAIIAVLVSAICALIREYGGFDVLLYAIRKMFKGKNGGQLGMGLIVGALDIATANNTVAIVIANPIASEMSQIYGIRPKKAACILDTFSCVFQAIIPYGAQMLVAVSAAAQMGYSVSAFSIIPYLFYPFLLLISSIMAILVVREKKST